MFDLLDQIDTTHLSDDDLTAIRYMIVFHDVVYKLNREKGWNEAKSAKYGVLALEAILPDDMITMIYDGIVCSATHTMNDNYHPMWKIATGTFLDLDLLAGLGISGDDFTRNTELIRSEYAPLYTSDEFDIGRAKWARSMLNRPTIYLTAQFKQYEAYARDCLGRFVTET